MGDILDFVKGKRDNIVSKALATTEGPAIVISLRQNEDGRLGMVVLSHGLSKKQAVQWLADAASELEEGDEA